MQRIRHPQQEVTIAVVGKYIDHRDAYKSIYEALDHAGFAHSARVLVKRIEAEELESQGPDLLLGGVDGILVPGGFGMRGVEGKVQAAQYAREFGIPYFGICLGMQCAVIEFARNVLQLEGANSTEFVAHTPHPVICMLEEQKQVTHKGGTMRLGLAALRPRRAIASGGLLRHALGPRAAPAPLRIQSRVPPAVRGGRLRDHRDESRPEPARDRRNSRASLVRGRAVPSGVPLQAPAAAPAVCRFCRGGHRPPPGPRAGDALSRQAARLAKSEVQAGRLRRETDFRNGWLSAIRSPEHE